MSQWIDITRTLHNGMVQWPSDRVFKAVRTLDYTGPGSANVTEIEACVHIGTHLDAPLHFTSDGAGIDHVPLDTLCGPCVVLDIPVERDITAADLDGVIEGERVLLRTANRHLWAKGTFDPNYHALTQDAATLLIERNVPLVGIDYLSIDPFDSPDSPVHHALLEAGIPILEAVDLDHVSPGRYELIAMPIKIAGADGAPARAALRFPVGL